jgi:hypothetical protein
MSLIGHDCQASVMPPSSLRVHFVTPPRGLHHATLMHLSVLFLPNQVTVTPQSRPSHVPSLLSPASVTPPLRFRHAPTTHPHANFKHPSRCRLASHLRHSKHTSLPRFRETSINPVTAPSPSVRLLSPLITNSSRLSHMSHVSTFQSRLRHVTITPVKRG